MKTRHLHAQSEHSIQTAADCLAADELVVLPTDTVYGVGASAFSAAAIAKLYAAKNRSLAKGIPILLSDKQALQQIAQDVPPEVETLIDRFWPGPLTIIFPKRPELPANLSPNDGVAVRMPNNDIARQLIAAAGGALAVTSANPSGLPPALSAAEAADYLDGEVAAIIDNGAGWTTPLALGVPSTIVSFVEGQVNILRSGPLSKADLTFDEARE